MIHPQDQESLQRMTGLANLPADLVDEVDVTTRVYHRGGGSGPLGVMPLVHIIRQFGLGRRSSDDEISQQAINWRNYPSDGRVKVEARFYGQWCPGRYFGFIENGKLAVRLDDDPYMKECRADMVRLAADQTVTADTLQTASDEDESEAAERRLEASGVEDDPEENDTGEVVEEGAIRALVDTDFPWSDVDPGAPVWYDDGDDIHDAKFESVSRTDEDGKPTHINVTLDAGGGLEEVAVSWAVYAGDEPPEGVAE